MFNTCIYIFRAVYNYLKEILVSKGNSLTEQQHLVTLFWFCEKKSTF